MKRSELVFIPSPGIGHVTSTVELALLLVSRDDRFVVTIILMKLPFDEKFTSYCKSLTESTISNNIKFLYLPLLEQALDMKAKDILAFYMETYKPLVKEALAQLIESSTSSPDKPPRLIGLLVDMFCVTMVDVGNDFGLSSYVFFTSGVGYLSLLFSMQTMKDEQNVDSTQFKDSDTELVISGFAKPIPARVLPSMFLNKDVVPGFLELARKYRQTKGIVVNTFLELESHVMSSFFEGLTLPIYPVGPILKLQRDEVKMVSAEEIERGINSLMQKNSEIERKVKEMSEKSKEALMEGGSSHTLLGHLVILFRV
ncbi:hypothetical protein OIU77_029444 [Salix suchowensis]|uniref:Uncharacterized protein n=1 Tax=Salix suchowensis TaxID=1278906 RepID=A0ABQ9BBV2_9ROSI|nr:hypothetical protein OIU77_029444 [Salix suchowensis]